MKQLPDGTWELEDGRILTSEQLTQLNRNAPIDETKTVNKSVDLKEGQSSGIISLCD